MAIKHKGIVTFRAHDAVREKFAAVCSTRGQSAGLEAAMYLWAKLSPEKRAEFLKQTALFVQKAREVEAAEKDGAANIEVSDGS